MQRRSFLASSALAVTVTAGCLGDDSDDGGAGDEGSSDEGAPDRSADGYAPESVEAPEPMDVDPDSFERLEVDGTHVPLAPVEVTYNWYARREARFVDARGGGQYDDVRVEGAAWSPAPDGREDDPVDGWSTTDRVVCYCGCPHHLSSLRAASLLEDGYEDVYVIDEGLGEWIEREYPTVGENARSRVGSRVIRGRSDAVHAGEPVYAAHVPTDQREAAFVGDDGGYEMTLHFADVGDDSEIRVEAPDYTVVAPLSELTDGVITGE